MADVRLHEHIEGEHWPLLSAAQKLAVVEQLNLMVSSIRSLKQSPWNAYIGLFLAALGQFTIDLSGSASLRPNANGRNRRDGRLATKRSQT